MIEVETGTRRCRRSAERTFNPVRAKSGSVSSSTKSIGSTWAGTTLVMSADGIRQADGGTNLDAGQVVERERNKNNSIPHRGKAPRRRSCQCPAGAARKENALPDAAARNQVSSESSSGEVEAKSP